MANRRTTAELDNSSERAHQIDLLLSRASAEIETNMEKAMSTCRAALRRALKEGDKWREARARTKIGQVHFHRGEYELAHRESRQAVDLALDCKVDRTTAHAMACLGNVVDRMGNRHEAIEIFRRALEMVEPDQHPKLTAWIYRALHTSLDAIGCTKEGLEYLHAARLLCEASGDIVGQIAVATAMGGSYSHFDDAERAEESLNYALDLSRTHGIDSHVSQILTTLGMIHIEREEWDQGIERFLESVQLAEQRRHATEGIASLVGLCVAYKAKGEPERARHYIERALEIAVAAGDYRRPFIAGKLAELLADGGELQRAVEMVHECLGDLEQQSAIAAQVEMHRLLSNFYERLEDGASALKHYKLCMSLREQVVGAKQQQLMRDLQLRVEAERAAREREALEFEQRRLAEEMERKSKELTSMALQMVEKNEFLDALKRELTEVTRTADVASKRSLRMLTRMVEEKSSGEEWKLFETQFEQVHSGFVEALSQRHRDLTRTELKVCALLKLGMSTKEIANIIATGPKNVEMHRYRLRKKLGLGADESFISYFSTLSVDGPRHRGNA